MKVDLVKFLHPVRVGSQDGITWINKKGSEHPWFKRVEMELENSILKLTLDGVTSCVPVTGIAFCQATVEPVVAPKK